ncbi:MAG: HPr family phosphocarrier protein [Rhodothalassiaceae bacterium]
MIRHRLTLTNKRGLHARASAKFVKLVAGFDADVWVEREGMRVTGTSIMGLMLLAAAYGDSIEVSVQGRDAAAALKAIEELLARKFDEEDGDSTH